MLSNSIADAINVQTTINNVIMHITQAFWSASILIFIAQSSKCKPVLSDNLSKPIFFFGPNEYRFRQVSLYL